MTLHELQTKLQTLRRLYPAGALPVYMIERPDDGDAQYEITNVYDWDDCILIEHASEPS